VISSRHKFIFLHVPKTAGNAVQSFLLPYSDDQKVVHRHQDGVERFDVRGAVTPNKHAMLEAYASQLGPKLAEYEIILPIRDPLDRALSLYFSPHRAFGQPAGFVPRFEAAGFEALLNGMPAMVDYLRVGGEIRRPDHLLRFDSIVEDLRQLAAHFGLPAPVLPVLNRSLDQSGERERLKANAEVIARVRERFAEDYDYFGFPLRG
jgi:Sulfotransferase family